MAGSSADAENQTIAGRIGVRPGADEVTFTIRDRDRQSSRIIGRVVAANGQLPDGARLIVNASMRSFYLSLDPASGRFESKLFQPGRYELNLIATTSAPGPAAWVPLARVQVSAGQTLDLGEIRLDPPGSLVVSLLEDNSLAHSKGGIAATGDRGRIWGILGADGKARFPALPPGRYHLVASTWPKRAAAKSTTVTIESGRESSIEISATLGIERRLSLRGLDSADVPGTTIRVHAEGDGAILMETVFPDVARTGDPEFPGSFAPGKYVATAETTDGRKASASFEIRGDGKPPVVIEGFR